MQEFIVGLSLLALLFSPIIYLIWDDNRRARLAPPDPVAAPSDPPASDASAFVAASLVQPTVAPHPNEQHLAGVRSRSCYPGLRGLHGFITFVAVAGCVVLWLVLMNVGNNTADRVYATFVCGLVTVGAILEYGLFTLIVDAVDVLIDNGRRESERK